TAEHDPGLRYSERNIDQFMINEDGYTRWFNPSEFTTPGIFGYTPGILASADYTGTANLNPYKYFADNLDDNDNPVDFLMNTDINGAFSAMMSNIREYRMEFPFDTGIKFGYAIVAQWAGGQPENHPTNAPEALAAKFRKNETIWYGEPGYYGGELDFYVSVFSWEAALNGGVMEDYSIVVESTVLDSPHVATVDEMTPLLSGDNWHMYHFNFTDIFVESKSNQEIILFVESSGTDYTNPFGIHNAVESEPITVAFRYPLTISNPPQMDFDVSMTTSFSFSPMQLYVPAGATVTWTNNSSVPHTATADPLNPVGGGPNSDIEYPLGLSNGDQYIWTVPDEPSGTVWYYHCKFHAVPGDGTSLGTGMVGSIMVL
ncbi:MAG: hypothetical protein ABIG42_01635, partial [bacterium]